VTFASCFLTIYYQFNAKSSMMLFGLIISFPLVFSLQSAFKRRERALEYCSDLRAGLVAVKESFQKSKKLSEPKQIAVNQLITLAFDEFTMYLKTGNSTQKIVHENFTRITAFGITNQEEVSSKVIFRVSRYMKDVNKSVSYLMSLKTHRTIVGIRILSYVFITIFPVVQASFLLNTFGEHLPQAIIYFIAFVTSMSLSALLVIQKQLEDPFDQDGLDDIKLDEFSFRESALFNRTQTA